MGAPPAADTTEQQDSWSDTDPATMALARRNVAFMAKWNLIDPKPSTYQAKVPNQYPSKLRKLPLHQRHYALLDEQEHWMEMLADHFPPDWVDISQVLHHLATIVPMHGPSKTGPYRALRQLLSKAADYGSRAGKDATVDIRCPAIPLPLLFAVKIYGSAQRGAGDMPHTLAEFITEAHLQWLMQNPSEAVIPKCWQVWAINHKYPHAAYIGKPADEREPTPRVPGRSLSHLDDRLNIKAIPRRFSMPHRRSPQHESSPGLTPSARQYIKENDGMLIEDEEDFELWDASFHEEDDELAVMPHDLKAYSSFDEPTCHRTYRRASTLRPQSPSNTRLIDSREQSFDIDPVHPSDPDETTPVPFYNTDQQANVFNIKTLDDVRELLADLNSQRPIRCPTASELLPFADNDVHEAFRTYTRYLGAKVKAAMQLTLGQVFLSSPFARLMKESEASRLEMDSYRREAESVRRQLPRALSAVNEEHRRDVANLRSEISKLKGTIEKRDRKARGADTQVPFQITTRAAARAEKISVVRQTRSKTQGGLERGHPSKYSRSGNAAISTRKRGLTDDDGQVNQAKKRSRTAKGATNLKNVYASYFGDDE